jgi:hypothetical protein
MGCTACTEPQCLYKGETHIYIYIYKIVFDEINQHNWMPSIKILIVVVNVVKIIKYLQQ